MQQEKRTCPPVLLLWRVFAAAFALGKYLTLKQLCLWGMGFLAGKVLQVAERVEFVQQGFKALTELRGHELCCQGDSPSSLLAYAVCSFFCVFLLSRKVKLIWQWQNPIWLGLDINCDSVEVLCWKPAQEKLLMVWKYSLSTFLRMIFLFTLKGYFSINFFPSYHMYIARNKRDQKPFHIAPLHFQKL